MFITNNFKDRIKNGHLFLKSSREISQKPIYKKTVARKVIQTALLLSIFTLPGCSTISQKVTSAVDTVKGEVQTSQDEIFRMKRVRSSLALGDITTAEEHRDTLFAKHFQCIAKIEIAAATYQEDKESALKMIEKTTEEIWEISDANNRAMALLSLLSFEIETKKDVPVAKETIKQIKQTITFILDNEYQKLKRHNELLSLLKTHNHLLSR